MGPAKYGIMCPSFSIPLPATLTTLFLQTMGFCSTKIDFWVMDGAKQNIGADTLCSF